MAYNKKLLFPSEAPVWITEAGSLGDYSQDGNAISNISLSAAEFFNSIITYSVTSGSLPTGLSLDSSTGVISGTLLNHVDVETVYFSITATDTDSQTTTRDFSIKVIPYIPIKYLVVAGGGAGGNGMGGGGGGGGLVTNHQGAPLLLAPGETHVITIGAGGAGTTSDVRVNGANSSFRSITAIGGGGASSLQLQRRQGILNGNPGGSGGGSGASDAGTGTGGAAQQPSSASGGYGNAGGNQTASAGNYPGAGGGGAGGPGESISNASQSVGGAGGLGLQVNIDGNNYYWAAGGGGDMYSGGSAGGPGGIGGGGGGATISGSGGTGGASAINSGFSGGIGGDSNGGNAGANTGSGGGGAAWSNGRGGNGGSGIVILTMPASRYTGLVTGNPQVTTNGVEIILTYTGSGTYTS